MSHTTTSASSTTSSTSTSTTGPDMVGGNITKDAFRGWLSVWRSKYQVGLWKAGVPDPWDSMLPKALKGVEPKVVTSEGGVASGVVTEGMGYGIMIEGFLAAQGDDWALQQGLALVKSWLGMVVGPNGDLDIVTPLAGGTNFNTSSTKAENWPYGVSSVEWSHLDLGAAGLAAWKFPIKEKDIDEYLGSAADGDQDAVMGMVYLAAAMNYPDDFVDMVMRTVISFASADLGFPDLYRVLPDGTKIFVPKLGSMWGGLLPATGKYKSKQEPWCYSPGYFAPAHYRTMRNFVNDHWKEAFNDYLPKHEDGTLTSAKELSAAFDSAVIAGYNILWFSSCESGAVSNWVGVESACSTDDELNCPGVPWKHTPWVGANGGECQQSGTRFGAFGAEASRTAWRVAMDYKLFREESSQIPWYDRDGNPDPDRYFGARAYLNRLVIQYKYQSLCDGGIPGDCMQNTVSPFELAHAFEPEKGAHGLNCSNVPNPPQSWWAGFMSYPTFSAFIAPFDEIGEAQMTFWMDTFAGICNFSRVNVDDFASGGSPEGKLCLTSYFEASQAVIATMIMSGSFGNVSSAVQIPKNLWTPPPTPVPVKTDDDADTELTSEVESSILYDEKVVPSMPAGQGSPSRLLVGSIAASTGSAILLVAISALRSRHGHNNNYEHLVAATGAELPAAAGDAAA